MKKTLQELRKDKNLTQEQTAKLLTITKEYLSMLENGDRNPSDSLKEKMSKLYNCSISDIFLAISSTKRLKNKNMPTN
jgi:putative transcriptional regulator